MPPLLVLFDVDGTLFLTPDDLYVRALVAAVEEVYGREPGREALGRSDNAGMTATGGLRSLLRADGFDEAAIERGLDDWCERFVPLYLEFLAGADTSHWEFAPHAPETLEVLRRDGRIALLTGNPEPVARARMQRLALAPFFPPGQGAFGCEAEERAELVELARERAGGWPRERTVLVGDTPRDVEGARAAGVRAIGITLGRFGAGELAGADAVVDGMPALPATLRGL